MFEPGDAGSPNRRLDNTTESRLTSLLYGDNDVVDVMVSFQNEHCAISDDGEAEWLARVRHLSGDKFTTEQHSKAQAIAARWNVEFKNDEVATTCTEAELQRAVKRVALAS